MAFGYDQHNATLIPNTTFKDAARDRNGDLLLLALPLLLLFFLKQKPFEISIFSKKLIS